MDPYSRWKVILSRFRRKLPLDVEHCSPIALRHIILDVRTPPAILDRIAQAYCDDEHILRDLVRCPNLSETTLAFIALAASDEVKSFISGTRVMELVAVEDALGALVKSETALAPGAKFGPAGAGKEKKKAEPHDAASAHDRAAKDTGGHAGAKEARGLLVRGIEQADRPCRSA